MFLLLMPAIAFLFVEPRFCYFFSHYLTIVRLSGLGVTINFIGSWYPQRIGIAEVQHARCAKKSLGQKDFDF